MGTKTDSNHSPDYNTADILGILKWLLSDAEASERVLEDISRGIVNPSGLAAFRLDDMRCSPAGDVLAAARAAIAKAEAR